MDFAHTSGSLVKFRDSIVTADLENGMRARVDTIRKKKRIRGVEECTNGRAAADAKLSSRASTDLS